MSHTVDQDGVNTGVTEQNLQTAAGRRVLSKHRLELLLDRLKHQTLPYWQMALTDGDNGGRVTGMSLRKRFAGVRKSWSNQGSRREAGSLQQHCDRCGMAGFS